MSATALKSTKRLFSSLNHQNFEFFRLVPRSPTHTGLICGKTLEPNISSLGPFKGGADKNPEKWADSGPFFMDGLVQHFRWGEVFMTEIQDHYARNINIIKTSCPVISIASHRTHWLFGGKYITHGPSSLSYTAHRSFGAGSHKEMSSILADQQRPRTVYEPKGGVEGLRVSANEHSCEHGALINFGDLTPYLTYSIFNICFETTRMLKTRV